MKRKFFSAVIVFCFLSTSVSPHGYFDKITDTTPRSYAKSFTLQRPLLSSPELLGALEETGMYEQTNLLNRDGRVVSVDWVTHRNISLNLVLLRALFYRISFDHLHEHNKEIPVLSLHRKLAIALRENDEIFIESIKRSPANHERYIIEFRVGLFGVKVLFNPTTGLIEQVLEHPYSDDLAERAVSPENARSDYNEFWQGTGRDSFLDSLTKGLISAPLDESTIKKLKFAFSMENKIYAERTLKQLSVLLRQWLINPLLSTEKMLANVRQEHQMALPVEDCQMIYSLIRESDLLRDLLAENSSMPHAIGIWQNAFDDSRVERLLGGEAAPLSLEFTLTEECNLACEHCHLGRSAYPQQEVTPMALSDIKAQVDEYVRNKGTDFILFAGGGEPTLSPVLEEVINYIRDNYPNVFISLFTNGVEVDFDKIGRLFDGPGKIRFNLSVWDVESYSSNKGVCPEIAERYFSDTIRNIRKASAMVSSQGNKARVEVSYVVTSDNYEMLEQFIDMLSEQNLDCEVVLSADNRHEGGFLDYIAREPQVLRAVQEAERILRDRGYTVSSDEPFFTFAFAQEYGLEHELVKIPIPTDCVLESSHLKPVSNVVRGIVTPCVVKNLAWPLSEKCENTPSTCSSWFLPEIMIMAIADKIRSDNAFGIEPSMQPIASKGGRKGASQKFSEEHKQEIRPEVAALPDGVRAITGATGFIGRAMAVESISAGEGVAGIVRPETKKLSVLDWEQDGLYRVDLDLLHPDYHTANEMVRRSEEMYHLGARTDQESIDGNVAEIYTANSLVSGILANLSEEYGTRMLFASSFRVYEFSGADLGALVKEDQHIPSTAYPEHSRWLEKAEKAFVDYIEKFIEQKGDCEEPLLFVREYLDNNPIPPFDKRMVNPHYSFSKLLAERLVLRYRNAVVVRLGNIYGPGQPDSATIPYYIRSIMSASPGEDFPVWNRKRNSIFIGDAVTIINRIVKEDRLFDGTGDRSTRIINLVAPRDVPSVEIAHIINEHLDQNVNVRIDPEKDVMPTYRLDNSRLSSVLGEYEFITLKTGLEKTVDHYRELFRIKDGEPVPIGLPYSLEELANDILEGPLTDQTIRDFREMIRYEGKLQAHMIDKKFLIIVHYLLLNPFVPAEELLGVVAERHNISIDRDEYLTIIERMQRSYLVRELLQEESAMPQAVGIWRKIMTQETTEGILGGEIRPLSVEVALTERCNMDCTFCPRKMEDFPSEEASPFTLAEVKGLIDEYYNEQGVDLFLLGGGGEPTLSPNLVPLIDYVRETYPDAGLYLFTNGTELDLQKAQKIFEGRGKLRFAFGVGCQEDFMMDRVPKMDSERAGNYFSAIVSKIREAVRMSQQFGGKCNVEVNFVVTEENFHKLPAFAELMIEERLKGCTIVFNSDNRQTERYLQYLLNPDLLDSLKEASSLLEENGFKVALDDPFIAAFKAERHDLNFEEMLHYVPQRCWLEELSLKPVVNIERGYIAQCLGRSQVWPPPEVCTSFPHDCKTWILSEIAIMAMVNKIKADREFGILPEDQLFLTQNYEQKTMNIVRALTEDIFTPASELINIAGGLDAFLEISGEIRRSPFLRAKIEQDIKSPVSLSIFREMLLKPEWIRKVSRGEKAPLVLEVHASYECELNCRHCYAPPEGELSDLKQDKAFEVVDYFLDRGVEQLIMSGGGEPTESLLTSQIIKYVKQRAPEVHIYLITNGTVGILPEIAAHCDHINFSIDASTPGTFGKLKGVPRKADQLWRKIEQNIQTLTSLPDGPAITTSFVIGSENQHEVQEFIELGKRWGVDAVKFMWLIGKEDEDIDVTGIHRTLLQERSSLQEGDPHIYVRDPEVKQQKAYEGKCYVGASGIYPSLVIPTGKLYPCTAVADADFDRSSLPRDAEIDIFEEDWIAQYETSWLSVDREHCAYCKNFPDKINCTMAKLEQDRAAGVSPEEQPIFPEIDSIGQAFGLDKKEGPKPSKGSPAECLLLLMDEHRETTFTARSIRPERVKEIAFTSDGKKIQKPFALRTVKLELRLLAQLGIIKPINAKAFQDEELRYRVDESIRGLSLQQVQELIENVPELNAYNITKDHMPAVKAKVTMSLTKVLLKHIFRSRFISSSRSGKKVVHILPHQIIPGDYAEKERLIHRINRIAFSDPDADEQIVILGEEDNLLETVNYYASREEYLVSVAVPDTKTLSEVPLTARALVFKGATHNLPGVIAALRLLHMDGSDEEIRRTREGLLSLHRILTGETVDKDRMNVTDMRALAENLIFVLPIPREHEYEQLVEINNNMFELLTAL